MIKTPAKLSVSSEFTGEVQSSARRWDLVLLISLLFVIILGSSMSHETLTKRFFLAASIFLPLTITTWKLTRHRRLIWLSGLLYSAIAVIGVANAIKPTSLLYLSAFALLTVFIAMIIARLFSYLRSAGETVSIRHLSTAASIYLLIGIFWGCVYALFETIQPGSFVHTASGSQVVGADLLYFSFVTLTTVGYGDISPTAQAVRMLSAMEAVTGVLYVAITISVLVGSYKDRS
jgi:hypothetical protein